MAINIFNRQAALMTRDRAKIEQAEFILKQQEIPYKVKVARKQYLLQDRGALQTGIDYILYVHEEDYGHAQHLLAKAQVLR